MKENENNNPSIIDELVNSLNIKNKTKITKNKKKKVKNERDIRSICKENKTDEEYIERKTIYKVNKKDVKEEYDIIMDCDDSDYIIYHKRK